MNDLQIFNYKESPVRTIERDDGVWWVLKDVCETIGIRNHSNVVPRLDEDEKALYLVEDPNGKVQQTVIINESGLYNVILRSDKPEAKDFKRWVTHDVLPSIRKTGLYSAHPSKPLKQPRFPDGVTLGSLVSFMKFAERNILDRGGTAEDIRLMIKETCEAVNFPIPTALSKQLPGQMDLFNRAGLEVAQ